MVTNLIDTKKTLDMKMQQSEMQIFTGGRKLTAKDVKETFLKGSANSTGNNVPKEVVDSDLDEELDELRKEYDYTGLKQKTVIDSSGRSRRMVIFNDDDDFAEKIEESDQEDEDSDSDEGFEQNKNTVYTVLKDNKDQTIHDKVTTALKILERNKPSKPNVTSDFEENSTSSNNDDSDQEDDESFEDSNESDDVSLSSNESLVGVTEMKKKERIINVEDISIAKEKKKFKRKKKIIKISNGNGTSITKNAKNKQILHEIEDNSSSDEENRVQSSKVIKFKDVFSKKQKLKRDFSNENEVGDNSSYEENYVKSSKVTGKTKKSKDLSSKKKNSKKDSRSEEKIDDTSSNEENCVKSSKVIGKTKKSKNVSNKKNKPQNDSASEAEIILEGEKLSKSKKIKKSARKAKEMEIIEEKSSLSDADDSIMDEDLEDDDLDCAGNTMETEEMHDESDEQDMSVRWKENLSKKARDAFLDRQKTTQNIMKLVYGNFCKFICFCTIWFIYVL